MGRDKSLLVVDGQALAATAARALTRAGAAEVFCVGGDEAALVALGLAVVADRHPGEGPLGGLVTALSHAREDLVVVLSCDLPGASPQAVEAVVEALRSEPGSVLAVPVHDGHRQFLHGAYRRRSLPAWEAAFASGERSLRRPAARLSVVEVSGLDPAWLHDADAPQDLPDPPE